MKTIRNTIVAALAFAGAFSFGAVASAAPEYPADQTLTVQLVDAESVHPIAGAKVSIYNYVTGETILVKSDNKGWVKVDSLYGDEFAVHVRNTQWHCGGQVMTDHFDRFEHANLFVNQRDGNSFSAGHLGAAAMSLRSASGTC